METSVSEKRLSGSGRGGEVVLVLPLSSGVEDIGERIVPSPTALELVEVAESAVDVAAAAVREDVSDSDDCKSEVAAQDSSKHTSPEADDDDDEEDDETGIIFVASFLITFDIDAKLTFVPVLFVVVSVFGI